MTLDLLALEHRASAGVAKSQAQALPVLELGDGTVIGESIAIGRYLETLYPEPNLFGNTARECAEVEMWMRRCEQNFAVPAMMAARLSHPALGVLEAPNPEVADYFVAQATRFADALDLQLETRDFITGGRLTIVDIVVICALDFARIIRLRPDRDRENLRRWAGDMRARPAAKAAP